MARFLMLQIWDIPSLSPQVGLDEKINRFFKKHVFLDVLFFVAILWNDWYLMFTFIWDILWIFWLISRCLSTLSGWLSIYSGFPTLQLYPCGAFHQARFWWRDEWLWRVRRWVAGRQEIQSPKVWIATTWGFMRFQGRPGFCKGGTNCFVMLWFRPSDLWKSISPLNPYCISCSAHWLTPNNRCINSLAHG